MGCHCSLFLWTKAGPLHIGCECILYVHLYQVKVLIFEILSFCFLFRIIKELCRKWHSMHGMPRVHLHIACTVFPKDVFHYTPASRALLVRWFFCLRLESPLTVNRQTSGFKICFFLQTRWNVFRLNARCLRTTHALIVVWLNAQAAMVIAWYLEEILLFHLNVCRKLTYGTHFIASSFYDNRKLRTVPYFQAGLLQVIAIWRR